MAEDLSPGEIARTLHRLEEGIGKIVDRFERLDASFVTRSEHKLRADAVDKDVNELRDDVKELRERNATNFRLALVGIVFPIITGVLTAVLIAAVMR